MATLTQSHFRFGKDDGTEAAHTFWQLEDVNHSQEITANWTFLLRFCEQVTTAISNVDAQFQYNKNGAGWVNITTSSTVVKAVAVGAFTDAQACTKRLSGTGTFESSGAGCTEDGLSGGNANDIVLNGNSETECGLQVVFTDVVNGDTIQFRLTSPDATMAYAVTPTLAIVIATLMAIGDEVQKIWNIRQAIPDTSQSIWNVRYALGDTVQHIWHIRSLTTKSIQLVHNTLTAIGDTSEYIWNVLVNATAVGDIVDLVWHARETLGKTSQSIWHILISIAKTNEHIWHTRQVISDTLETLYDVKLAIGNTKEVVWHTLTSVYDTLQTVWNVLISVTAVGDTFQLIWHIRQAIGKTRQAVWNVLENILTTWDTIQLLWEVRIRRLHLTVAVSQALNIVSQIKDMTAALSITSCITRGLAIVSQIQSGLSIESNINTGLTIKSEIGR